MKMRKKLFIVDVYIVELVIIGMANGFWGDYEPWLESEPMKIFFS